MWCCKTLSVKNIWSSRSLFISMISKNIYTKAKNSFTIFLVLFSTHTFKKRERNGKSLIWIPLLKQKSERL